MNTLLTIFAPLLQQPEVTTQTLWEFLRSGGPVMVPIGLCSVVVMAFAMERYLRLRRSHVCPPDVIDALERVHADDLAVAQQLVTAGESPGARILAAGLRRRGYPLQEVERVMEDQAQKEVERLHAPIRPISIIANITPLMGLLGTVLGIAESFHRVVRTGMGKPEHLAAGIEEALTTTIGGLVVAIPAMLIAAHLTSRQRRLTMYLDEKLAPAVERIAAPAEDRSDAA